jgi:hypothetical protein
MEEAITMMQCSIRNRNIFQTEAEIATTTANEASRVSSEIPHRV